MFNVANASSGACSGHDGVNCSANSDSDGSVICNDGWRDSSVLYADIQGDCQGQYVETSSYHYVAKTEPGRDLGDYWIVALIGLSILGFVINYGWGKK